MNGAPLFTLDPPDIKRDPGVGAARPTAGAGGAVQRAAGAARVVPFPPWLPYAPDPGTYNQWWLAETAGAGAADLEK